MEKKVIETIIRAIGNDLRFLIRIVRNRIYSLIVFLLVLIGMCIYFYMLPAESSTDVLKSLGLFMAIDSVLILTAWSVRKTTISDITSLNRISILITTAFMITFAAKYNIFPF